MNHFSNIIDLFEPISLQEMDSVSLLDRTDLKFVFRREKLDDILKPAQDNYRVLEINGLRYADYETYYFDTENYKFYFDHHNQRSDRYKVRMRSYVNSDLHFFEIKHKSNKNRTIKSRVKIPRQEECIKNEAADLLHSVIGIPSSSLKRSVQITCKRTTFVNKELTERVTIDYNLSYQLNDCRYSYPELVIVEIKQSKAGKSLFRDIMRQQHIRSTSLSKYSFGIANFIQGIRNNNFKTQIIYVKKITNQTAI